MKVCRKYGDPLFRLGELRSATSGLETVLLSLLHTRVAGQEAGGLQSGTVLSVGGQQSAGNTVTDSTGLTGDTATCDVGNDVELTGGAGNAEGLVDDELQGLETEVIIDGTAVDGDLTGAGIDANASDGLLSAAGATKWALPECFSARINTIFQRWMRSCV